ncbi:BET1 homolog [Neocloeon triangulifer]|uniref:BET1 homolog n=1 Tax=Neocloeon triangulifer TaxID=2078957 RepID=UPI00286EFDDE|nr:BET1 homolog [Neocloeon triangulifer]XP_059490923.1 BET1 homolog [Neocloeon triangulifer]XP_059490924.1 BET1 homolog [Neocloeon triangulifer]
MRRSHANQTYSFQPNSPVEEENERMTDQLKDKIGSLRTLCIDMGTEVKYHNKLLTEMDDDMEGSRGFIGKAMDRVIRLSKGSHNYHLVYLFLFCLFVFFLLWIILKFR